VAVLVLDASEGVTQQDFRLAEYIVSGRMHCDRGLLLAQWLAAWLPGCLM